MKCKILSAHPRFAFDPEKGAKGGVKNLEEEIERYRRPCAWTRPCAGMRRVRYSEILRTQIVDSVTLVHGDIALGAKVRCSWQRMAVAGWAVVMLSLVPLVQVLVEGANAALLDIDFGRLAEVWADWGLVRLPVS